MICKKCSDKKTNPEEVSKRCSKIIANGTVERIAENIKKTKIKY